MLARGASLVANTNGANGAASGAYKTARCAAGTRRNCARVRAQLARQPRVRTLTSPRRTRPMARSIRKRASASENAMTPRNSG
jgi:hypothetical protein